MVFIYDNIIHDFVLHLYFNLDHADPNWKNLFFWFVLAMQETDDTRMDVISVHVGDKDLQDKKSNGYLLGTISLVTAELRQCRPPYKIVDFKEDLIFSEFRIKKNV